MDNENIQVHIWELPEKTDDIDKVNDYTIIHDGVELKKVAIEKLYEYFNQDYKIENTVLFFETLMSHEDKRFEELYDKLELSIEEYREIIKKIIEKFLTNRGKLRELETNINKKDFEIEDITKSFESIGQKHSTLSDEFKLLDTRVSLVEAADMSCDISISELNDSADTINTDKVEVENNTEYISSSVKNVSKEIDTDIKEKDQILTENINNLYDKIISILDYYHHIHDEE